ncbi:hypothetical protein QR680_002544 [Steinernema hermaphroditum]|uniref:Uncharacterized protein n=1 Tax=Steinernema hermaphroditum TaxID=289476 RepID=A0AA39LIJ4_9BILA|nr:hypothetical protein QR680_002544 [Steinernema hermaphroditum]
MSVFVITGKHIVLVKVDCPPKRTNYQLNCTNGKRILFETIAATVCRQTHGQLSHRHSINSAGKVSLRLSGSTRMGTDAGVVREASGN